VHEVYFMQTVAKSLFPLFKMAEKMCEGRIIRPDRGVPVTLLELKKTICDNKEFSLERLL
jgi:hypothetical protein